MRGLFAIVLSAFVLVACGSGGDGGSSGSKTTDPAFVGRWIGTWTSTGSLGNQSGSADMTVASDGAISGILQNTTAGVTGTMTGHVDANGKVSGSYSYPGYEATSSGQMVIQANGHLGGVVDTYEGTEKVGTSTFDLVKQ